MNQIAIIGSTDLALQENRSAARSKSTTRMLQSHWRAWESWAQQHNLSSRPADLRGLERYLVALGETVSAQTVAARLWAINQAHKMSGMPEPGQAEGIRLALAGIKRRKGTRAKQAQPITLDHLRALPEPITLAEVRDRALLLVGWAAALRRSEIAAIDVEHLELAPTGLRLLIPFSKTDQQGRGQTVDILRATRGGPCPVGALQAWLAAAAISEGPVFRAIDRHGTLGNRLTGGSIARIVKTACVTLGLDPATHGGHSLRAGAATWWSDQGKPAALIAQHGRWGTLDMVLRYTRSDVAKEFGGAY